jgi:hypothetical protein
MGIGNIIFIVFFAVAVFWFSRNVKKIIRNIRLGREEDRSDNPKERWKIMTKVALGQSKMVVRPIAGFLHILIYVGFVIINIEVLEIIIDGVFGSHRILAPILGNLYNFLIGSFEVLAALVLLSCVFFLLRRNILYIKRFRMNELNGWPKSDANIILGVEILLMSAFLLMNAADNILQDKCCRLYSCRRFSGEQVSRSDFNESNLRWIDIY